MLESDTEINNKAIIFNGVIIVFIIFYSSKKLVCQLKCFGWFVDILKISTHQNMSDFFFLSYSLEFPCD